MTLAVIAVVHPLLFAPSIPQNSLTAFRSFPGGAHCPLGGAKGGGYCFVAAIHPRGKPHGILADETIKISRLGLSVVLMYSADAYSAYPV